MKQVLESVSTLQNENETERSKNECCEMNEEYEYYTICIGTLEIISSGWNCTRMFKMAV